MEDFTSLRNLMVETQLKTRGIKDKRVLNAMGTVERHLFVSELLKNHAYDDSALSIGEGQTISQPYMVAVMTELLELKGDEKVLEVGTGSGYQSAILSILCAEVFTIERIVLLAEKAEERFKKLGYKNIHVVKSDGTLGLPEQAPFDGIIVTAAAPEIPDTYVSQLKTGGRLVIPVGGRYSQILYQVKKTGSGIKTSMFTPCVFVPLIGKHGWTEGDTNNNY
ncbi:MAG: protein-L-isoaspartate(D-aspartate) O-methyltransferase [Nitrospirae bacterium]|nr:protein-L-isoaspartate(D-aspartate) O-methyltransferase [Nitrospirota bacterium]MBI4839463.1 protein-L-isoaspartate(D-aspartate) O-methyltransferase [Nitrospirota bacterium]